MSGYGLLFRGVHQLVQGTALGVVATVGVGESSTLDAPDPAILQPSSRLGLAPDRAAGHAIEHPHDRLPEPAAMPARSIGPETVASAPHASPPLLQRTQSAVAHVAFDGVDGHEALPAAPLPQGAVDGPDAPLASMPAARSFGMPPSPDYPVAAPEAGGAADMAAAFPLTPASENDAASALSRAADLPGADAPSPVVVDIAGPDAGTLGAEVTAEATGESWLGDSGAKRQALLASADLARPAGEAIAAAAAARPSPADLAGEEAAASDAAPAADADAADDAPDAASEPVAPGIGASSPAADGQAKEADLLPLQTLSRGGLALSGGYSSIEGPVGSIKIARTNIGAPGRDITASARYSRIQSLFEFGVSDRNFLNSRIAAAPTFFYSRSSATGFGSDRQSSAFRQSARGINLYLSRAFGPGFRVSANYRFADESFRIRGRDAVCDPGLLGSPFCNALGRSRSSIFSLGLSLDRRDSAARPTRGFQLRISQDFAGPGGTTRYVRMRAGGSFHRRIGGNLDVSLGLEGGWLAPIGGRSIPLFDRFYIGGNSMRGFDLRGLGPKVRPVAAPAQTTAIGGRAYYVARLEVATRLDGTAGRFGVSPSLFVDAGSVFGARRSELLPGETLIGNSAKPRVAAGVGLAFNTAPGKLRFDIAQPLVRQDGDRSKIFSISFGTAF